MKKSDFLNAGDRIRALPKAEQERIETLMRDMAGEMHLAEIRKALSVTQKDIAERTGMAQGEVSRFENAKLTGVKISTLERYVEAIGGKLRIVADMPDGTSAEIPLRAGKPVKSKAKAIQQSAS